MPFPFTDTCETGTAAGNGWSNINGGEMEYTTDAPIVGSKSFYDAESTSGDRTLQIGAGTIDNPSFKFLQRVAISGSNFRAIGPCIRMDSIGAEGYAATIHTGTDAIIIYNMAGYPTFQIATSLATHLGRAIVDGDLVWMRFEANGTTIRARAWFDGSAEPATWLANITDSTYTTGYVGFRNFDTLGIGPVAVDSINVTNLSAPSFTPSRRAPMSGRTGSRRAS